MHGCQLPWDWVGLIEYQRSQLKSKAIARVFWDFIMESDFLHFSARVTFEGMLSPKAFFIGVSGSLDIHVSLKASQYF